MVLLIRKAQTNIGAWQFNQIEIEFNFMKLDETVESGNLKSQLHNGET